MISTAEVQSFQQENDLKIDRYGYYHLHCMPFCFPLKFVTSYYFPESGSPVRLSSEQPPVPFFLAVDLANQRLRWAERFLLQTSRDQRPCGGRTGPYPEEGWIGDLVPTFHPIEFMFDLFPSTYLNKMSFRHSGWRYTCTMNFFDTFDFFSLYT